MQFTVIVFTVTNGLLIIRFSSSPLLEVIVWISPQSNLWLTTDVRMNVNITSFSGQVCIILKSISAVIYTITALKWCCHQMNSVSMRGRRIGKRDDVLKRYVLSLWCLCKVHLSGKIQYVVWIYGSISRRKDKGRTYRFLGITKIAGVDELIKKKKTQGLFSKAKVLKYCYV